MDRLSVSRLPPTAQLPAPQPTWKAEAPSKAATRVDRQVDDSKDLDVLLSEGEEQSDGACCHHCLPSCRGNSRSVLFPLPASDIPGVDSSLWTAVTTTASLHHTERYKAVLHRFSVALVTLVVEAQRGLESGCELPPPPRARTWRVTSHLDLSPRLTSYPLFASATPPTFESLATRCY